MSEPASPPATVVAHLVAVPLLILLERFAYYGIRSVEWPLLADVHGMELDEVASVYWWSSIAGLFAPLVGGLLAAVCGPAIVIVLGALACAGLYAMLGAPDTDPAGVFVALAVGHGAIKPALWALLAVQLADGRAFLRTASFAWAYVAVNVAAGASSVVFAPALDAQGFPVLFGTAAGALALVALGAGALWPVGRMQIWAEPDVGGVGRHAGLAGAAVALGVAFWMLAGAASSAGFSGAQVLGTSTTGSFWLGALNPLLVCTGGLVMVAVWVGVHLARLRVVDFIPVGVGLIALSIAAVAVHSTVVGLVGVPALGASGVALALCEVVVMPLLMARVACGTHWRLVPVWLGFWMFATAAASWATDLVGTTLGGSDGVLLVGAFIGGVAGVAAVAGGLVFREQLAPTYEPPG